MLTVLINSTFQTLKRTERLKLGIKDLDGVEIRVENKDCLELLKDIKSETIDMVFADPPFNLGIKYKGYIDDRKNYEQWCEQWIGECFRVLKSTGTFYLMTIDRYLEWSS